MKSIKEKAEEYSSGYMNLDRQQVAKQALEEGANYVLEQIEKVLQGDLNSHSAFKLKCIKQIIKELKE